MSDALLQVEGLTKDFPVGGGFLYGARPLGPTSRASPRRSRHE